MYIVLLKSNHDRVFIIIATGMHLLLLIKLGVQILTFDFVYFAFDFFIRYGK